MKNIRKNLDKYRNYNFSRCEYFKKNICTNEKGCMCRSVADMWAIMASILPEGYINLSFHDFEGIVNGEQVLDIEQVLFTKKLIWKYCWGDTWNIYPNKTMMTNSELDSISIMDNRFDNGTNIVIYNNEGNEGDKNSIKVQKGKSLIASIIMQQAIRRKIYESSKTTSYEWINFSILVSSLFRQHRNDENYEELWKYKCSDWLVIDNIHLQLGYTNPQKIFLINSFDDFFEYRRSNGLPTILVFQFNIHDIDILKHFGNSIYEIITSDNLFSIQV